MAVATDSMLLVQSAYDYLVEEITSSRIRTGARLSENRIATDLGISRTPVREALQRLEKEGLVRRGGNARFTVAQPTIKEAEEACDLLVLLDTFLAKRASERMNDEQKAQLLDLVETMTAAAEAGDREAWAESDIHFHRLLNSIADNALVSETVKETRRRVQRFWLQAPSMEGRLLACSHEHLDIAQAMIDRDDNAIARAVEAHVSHMRERVVELLRVTSVLFG
jgi:DNA-binding GntR family transcriptional regulator